MFPPITMQYDEKNDVQNKYACVCVCLCHVAYYMTNVETRLWGLEAGAATPTLTSLLDEANCIAVCVISQLTRQVATV